MTDLCPSLELSAEWWLLAWWPAQTPPSHPVLHLQQFIWHLAVIVYVHMYINPK